MIKFEKISKDRWDYDFDHNHTISQEIKDSSYNDWVKIPTRSTTGSAGYDFYVPYDTVLIPESVTLIHTGIKAYMEPDMFLAIYPRSSLGAFHGIVIANTVCIIDSDYVQSKNEGHIFIPLKNTSKTPFCLEKGNKIAQGIFQKFFTVDNEDISKIKQRIGGMGSTGK